MLLCLIYFGFGTVSYGIAYFLPQIQGIGMSVSGHWVVGASRRPSARSA